MIYQIKRLCATDIETVVYESQTSPRISSSGRRKDGPFLLLSFYYLLGEIAQVTSQQWQHQPSFSPILAPSPGLTTLALRLLIAILLPGQQYSTSTAFQALALKVPSWLHAPTHTRHVSSPLTALAWVYPRSSPIAGSSTGRETCLSWRTTYIDAFYVLGVSGGAPYVLACVEAIPRERLLGASVVSGIYPASLGTEGMSMGNRVLLWTAASKWIGALTGPMMDWMIGQVARDSEHPGRLTDLFVKEMQRKPERDAKCLGDEDVRVKLVEALRESFRQGGDGVAWDIKLIASDWGFDLAKLRTSEFGMCLWHGRGDTNVPVAMAEKAAGLMEGVTLRVLGEEAHVSVSLNRQDEILEALLLKH